MTPELRAAVISASQQEAGPAYAYVTSTGLSAANPGQGFRTELSTLGARVIRPGSSVALRLSAWGCPGALTPLRSRRPRPAEPVGIARLTLRGEYETDAQGPVEWYQNGPMGLEQGFTLATRPKCLAAAGGQLRFEVEVLGASSLLLTTARGEPQIEISSGENNEKLIYSDLYAQDADGKRVPAQMQVDGDRIVLTLDAPKARYPLTVDPLVWVQQTKLLADDMAPGTSFGYAVGVSQDTAVIGAGYASPGGISRAGAAYVFVRSGTVWTQQAKLVASDLAMGAVFGYSVAIANDTVLVGSIGASSFTGKVYVFTRSGTSWTEQAKLTASDAAASASFGTSVALAGDTAIISASEASPMALTLAGEAYIFTRSGTSWTEQAKLFASSMEAGARFGNAVAIEGSTVVVGAEYTPPTSTGAAYVFVGSGASWAEQAKLLASDKSILGHFGAAVALSGDTVLVGAGNAAYVLVRSGTSWTEQAKLLGIGGVNFGSSVAVAGDTAVVGDLGMSTPFLRQGAAYVFGRSGATWTQRTVLTASDKKSEGDFGVSAAISEDTLVIGASYISCSGLCPLTSAYAFRVLKSNGDLCTKDQECLSNVCAGGTCGKDSGTPCTATDDCKSAFCVDGVCCKTDCAGGTADCQACSKAAGASVDGTCGPRAATTVCASASASTCVAGGICDGITSPCKLAPAASTVVCSTNADNPTCRANYRCDGVTLGSCPATNPTPASSSTVCNSTGDRTRCAASFQCDGVKAGSCPVTNPTPASSSTVCNSTGDPTRCAASFRCDGVKAGSCPVTNPTPASGSTVCNPTGDPTRCAATFRCDGVKAGSCPVTNPTPASSSTVCSATGDPSRCIKAFQCDGVKAGSCPVTNPAPAAATVMCRAAISPCDAAEFCSGSMAACPADQPGPDNTSCSTGTCQIGQCRAESDLSIQFMGASQTSMQQPVPVQIHVKNTGKSAASDVTLTLTLPAAAGFAISQVMGAGWTCQTLNATATCTISQVPKNNVTEITFGVVPPLHLNEFTISGQLTSSTFDTNLINNSGQLSISNVAPCATACPSGTGGFGGASSGFPDSGAPDSGSPAGGCQMSGQAALPPEGWLALLGTCLILRRRSRRQGGMGSGGPLGFGAEAQRRPASFSCAAPGRP